MLELRADDDHVVCKLRLSDPRDLGTVLHRCRRLLDLDADPSGIDEVLGAHPALAPLVRETPGRRVPGAIDPHELAVRAVLGQQVSVAAARTIARRLARLCGAPVSGNGGGLSRLFPSAEAIADADLSVLGVPGTRRRTLQTLAAALARGDVVLDAGSDRQQAQRALRALPGIGPWTASYIALRALGDRDAFPEADLGIRRGARELGLPAGGKDLLRVADRWRPWRAYAAVHLWSVG